MSGVLQSTSSFEHWHSIDAFGIIYLIPNHIASPCSWTTIHKSSEASSVSPSCKEKSLCFVLVEMYVDFISMSRMSIDRILSRISRNWIERLNKTFKANNFYLKAMRTYLCDPSRGKRYGKLKRIRTWTVKYRRDRNRTKTAQIIV